MIIVDFKQGEVDLAIHPLLREMRQGAEIVLTRMLHDEQRTIVHQRLVKHQFGNFPKARQVVGRVGKDDIK